VVWGTGHPAAATDRRGVAVFSDAPRTVGDKDRVAPARLGGEACDRHGPAGVHPGDSSGISGRGGSPPVSADRREAGVSVARIGGRQRRPAGCCTAHRRPPGRSRGSGEVVCACCHRGASARLPQWRRGHWQDDSARPVAVPPGRQKCGVARAGPVHGALWRRGTVPARVRSVRAAGSWASGASASGSAAALRAYVAGATPRAGERR
jgi:hypothetical protein